MTETYNIEKPMIPQVKLLLDECRDKIEKLTGVKVSVNYQVRFHALSTQDLREIILKVLGVTWSEILSDKKPNVIVEARQFYAYFAYHVQGKRKVRIQEEMGYHDHTSVLYSIDIVTQRLEVKDGRTVMVYHQILEEINAILL